MPIKSMKKFTIPRIIKFSILIILVLIMIIFSSRAAFKGIDIQPKLPELISANTLQPERSESILNLPVKIPLANIEKALNLNIPQTFVGTESDPTDLLSNDNLTYEINRKYLSIGTKNNLITFSVPISGTARIKGKINLRFTKIPVSARTNIVGTIFGDLSLGIDNEWNIQPNLNVSTNLTKADVPIKNVGTISIRSLLKKQVDKAINKEKPKLIAELVKNLNLKAEVTKQWNNLHLSEQINKDPSIWIKTEPQNVSFKEFDLSDGENVQSGIAIEMFVDTCICKEAPVINFKQLPNLTIQEQIIDKFLINLPVQVSLDELNKTLQSKVRGKSLSVDENLKFIVNEINLSALGEKILVKVDFKADKGNFIQGAKGILYLWGNIFYDQESNNLKVVELDYDVDTKNALLSSADSLLKPILLQQIEERLSFPLDQELIRAKDEANKYIQQIKLPPEIDANIEVKTIEVEKVVVTNNDIYLVLVADGNMSALLNLGSKE
ncbi:MAG: DUF4403 family protein [Okeania sp. SIO3B5]|uniref:DUF4403 family protein n=1 Tax=Okeania sp. SIO3B5 TaxID=2607811 RepID=UPI0013FF65B9|nr:DUF4403 family protein [Okeania sp. SIO3B5]NEO55545.1 DUF4403 family protein [Okeania sp. SIO3B5]